MRMGLGQPMFQQQGRPQMQGGQQNTGGQRSQVMPRGDKVQSGIPGMKPQGQSLSQGGVGGRTSMYGDPFARVAQMRQQGRAQSQQMQAQGQMNTQVMPQGRAQGQQMQAQLQQQMREMMQQRMMQQRMMGGMGRGAGGIFSMFGQGRR